MFLLVPAHPGCPGQIPQSRKTVVCVCVTYLLMCHIELNRWLLQAHKLSDKVHDIDTSTMDAKSVGEVSFRDIFNALFF